jgi:hypothetical protein
MPSRRSLYGFRIAIAADHVILAHRLSLAHYTGWDYASLFLAGS